MEQFASTTRFVIIKQQFTSNPLRTLYTILNKETHEEFEMTPLEIYNSDLLLPYFSANDIRNICYTAILENELKHKK